MTRVPLEWHRVTAPREPVAVLAAGDAAGPLASSVERLLSRGREVAVAFGDGAVLALSGPDSLPWAPGATYLGEEHGLLLPTTLAPSIPADLLRGALRQLLGVDPRDLRRVVVVPGRVILFDKPTAPADRDELAKRAARGFA